MDVILSEQDDLLIGVNPYDVGGRKLYDVTFKTVDTFGGVKTSSKSICVVLREDQFTRLKWAMGAAYINTKVGDKE